ncbi:M24 family metallopeptidase [bacterium]|jgi:Xaa-Pro dipeptidase|nr:M24 family metallopeptidase [bacterium]
MLSVADIQDALHAWGLDGWLFIDFRGSDPLAYSILGLPADVFLSRRWAYYVPADGLPTRLVHAIESWALDPLPGKKEIYLPWKEWHERLEAMLHGSKRIAMQFSPMNAIPYVSRVDAGTIDLVRSFGVDVASSADLVQQFEAVLSDVQFSSHIYSANVIAQICQEAFDEIGRRLRSEETVTEFAIQQFIIEKFHEAGLVTDHPPIVAVDAHSADPHFSPTASASSPIGRGQSVLIDLWAKRREPGSIYADITRVGFTAPEIPSEYQKVFDIVQQARDAAIDFVAGEWKSNRPVTGAEVDDACRAVIQKAGFGKYFIHRTGHSIHQSTHGNGANIDNLETKDERRLIANTLFSIEPGIYLPGQFGIRSEINVFLSVKEPMVTGPARQSAVTRIIG